MAELNFGLLTPPGSQSIGNAFVQGMDQAAVARAQENQNALAQYTLSKAKREDEQQNKLYRDVQDPNFKFDFRTALQYGPQGMAALKAQQDAAAAEQTRALNQSQIAERQARLPSYVAEAFDKQMKPFSSAAYNSKNVDEAVASVNAMYDTPPLAAVLTKIKSREQAIADTTAAFNDPKTTDQWRQHWGGITPDKLYTQATVSANTAATLAQNKFQYENPSAYQLLQLEQVRKNHLETLAQQGWTFDTDRGVAVNSRLGISQPISTLMAPVEPQGSAGGVAPVAPAAPAAIPTAPSAAPAGTPPLQLNVTPGIAPSSASAMQIPQAIAGARVPQALQKVMDNDKLAILLKERENQVFLGRVDPALDREIANLQGRPTSGASQTVTQPAQRTVLGPKPEKPDASYYKEAKGIINTNNALNNLKQGISNLTPSDMVNPSRRSEITQLSKTVALLSKEMFGLGVLNAGDLTILEQVIPNPVAFNQGLVPIETIKKNLTRASNTINQINNTLSKVHKQPLLILDAETPSAPSPSAPPIQSFRRP